MSSGSKQHFKEIDKKTLRDFGILFGAIFLVLFGILLPYKWTGSVHKINLGIGLASILLGVVFPSILKFPYILWMKLGGVLGWINSRIILGILFFALFTPIAIVRRLLGKDSMKRKLDKSASSYKIIATNRNSKHMERPF